MAQPVNSWSEFRKILRQLKNEAVKEKFETIIIDTADIAYDLCEKYVCANAKRSDGGVGVDSVGEIPYGKGFNMVASEFDECLRKILQMNYGLILISHAVDKTFKDANGQEYQQIVPTLSNKARNIVSRMCDLIGYSRVVDTENGPQTKLFLRGTTRYIAGSRFKYTPDYIDFNYNSLVNAINEAIDKQASEDGSEYFTDTRNNLFVDTMEELDYDVLMKQFEITIESIAEVNKDDSSGKWSQIVTQIVEKYLGKGQKVSQCSRDQVEALSLIVDELKDFLKKGRC